MTGSPTQGIKIVLHPVTDPLRARRSMPRCSAHTRSPTRPTTWDTTSSASTSG